MTRFGEAALEKPRACRLQCPGCSSAFMKQVNLYTVDVWKCPECEALCPVGYNTEKPELQSRGIKLDGKRTSIRLEPGMWNALEEICLREKTTIHNICTRVRNTMECSSFTAAVRVYALGYYRDAATETGHYAVGHGALGNEPASARMKNP